MYAEKRTAEKMKIWALLMDFNVKFVISFLVINNDNWTTTASKRIHCLKTFSASFLNIIKS